MTQWLCVPPSAPGNTWGRSLLWGPPVLGRVPEAQGLLHSQNCIQPATESEEPAGEAEASLHPGPALGDSDDSRGLGG